VIDFTSSLYLGLRHARDDVRPWPQLTLGVPAALSSPPIAAEVARQLAALVGSERATLAPSTLHLFWDLFGALAGRTGGIFLDAATYPIARWGIERAAARGVPVSAFRHHDAASLTGRLRAAGPRLRRPVIVADGLCPGCGGPAPVGAMLPVVRRFGGLLVLDDTQAIGVSGHSPAPDAPYGVGGGGSLRWSGAEGPDVLVVSSLAKGFGVPMAMLAGARRTVSAFESASATRVHCSPPSFADLHAAERALALNGRSGDQLRRRLVALVRRFREGTLTFGLRTSDQFPVQTLPSLSEVDPFALHQRLLGRGVRTVLHRPRCGRGARVSLLITALHSSASVDAAVEAIGQSVRPTMAHR
jgi:8-amino-7-oxononanoate synthase